ncbi:hypothetical protein Tco_0990970 [Tanacetum coccineum]|uniref:Uncharacterized protein n=1 Tax=Tanacetum coccineum TaxID=301880 RepID=A0ABQ5EY02_9ASTR
MKARISVSGYEYLYVDIGGDTNSIAEYESEEGKHEPNKHTEQTVNEWFKTEIKKYRRTQQKMNQECAETRARIQKACFKNWETQIDLLIKKCRAEVTKEVPKSSIDQCRAIVAKKGAQANKLHEVSFVATDDEPDGDIPSRFLLYLGTSVNIMPKSMFEHLKLANLKETDMLVEMADMIKKPRKRSETMILGRPFLATIHAKIDVFNREISLGIGEDKVLFDMDGGIYHSKILVEKVYMANSIQEEESFNPLEIKDNLFSYESPACLLFEQCTRSCNNESINTLDSVDNMQELEVKHEDMVRRPNLESIISR